MAGWPLELADETEKEVLDESYDKTENNKQMDFTQGTALKRRTATTPAKSPMAARGPHNGQLVLKSSPVLVFMALQSTFAK